MQFFCQHCGALVRMLDLETKKIGCPNGCEYPISNFDPASSTVQSPPFTPERRWFDSFAGHQDRRIARFWKWLRCRMGIDGAEEHREHDRRV